MIIEDQPTDARVIVHYLQQLGVTAKVHPQCAGALDAIRAFKPDVCIVDIYLPDGSGQDIMDQVRADPELSTIALVITTASDDECDSSQRDPAVILRKPFTLDECKVALSKTLSAASPPASTTQSETSARILIAEDSVVNVGILKDYLESKGFEIIVATDGNQAVRCMQRQAPDLILMDIQMPGKDGLEATREIRASEPEGTRVPILALTALAMADDRDRCFEAGVDDYMSKPVGMKQLLETVERWLSRGTNG